MQTIDVVLAGLRGTLLAACGVGLSACTASSDTSSGTSYDKPSLFDEAPRMFAAKCIQPTPVLAENGKPTGYIRCSDGAINRESALECPVLVTAQACQGTEDHRMCNTAADCTQRPNGFCKTDRVSPEDSTPACYCDYPCTNDGDCKSGQVCMCPNIENDGPDVARCVSAECKTNSDCESAECGAWVSASICPGSLSLNCRSPEYCRSDETCPPEVPTCEIGRPLTVDHEVRVAELANRCWGEARLDGLSPEPGRAEYWLGVARMEHASVASFARFASELLRFGAPPRLLAQAFAAAADEVRHAEGAFAIASAYAGRPIGPGALRVDDLDPTDDPELFVTRLITEGCVGETLGVAEVLDMLAGDVDPRVRPHLEQVAADETRHAALAWQTLRWFRSRVNPAVIERAFEQALRSAQQVDHHARQVRALAIASVIEPCRQLCWTR